MYFLMLSTVGLEEAAHEWIKGQINTHDFISDVVEDYDNSNSMSLN